MKPATTSHRLRRASVVLGASALLLCASLASAAPVLSGPHFSPVDTTGSLATATADFNRDGRQDIAVAGYTNDTVSILYGKKGGGFHAPEDYPAGVQPLAIATADFNHDHRPDIVTADYDTPGTVTVLLSKHAGFRSPDTYSVGDGADQPDVGDFNRDGVMDMAVPSYLSDNVSILLGLGNGTFKHGKTLNGYGGPVSVVASDLNHDHKTDLAVLNYGSGIAWLQVFLGKGNGTFKAHQKLKAGADAPEGMVAGKFAGDGNLDLAVPDCDGAPNKVYILAGANKGKFKNPRGFKNYADSCSYEPAAIDLNHDGRQDIVTNTDSGTHRGDISVLFGKRGGKFSSPKFFPATGSSDNYAVAVGRFDGDNKADLVVSDYSVSRVGVLFGRG